MFVTSFADPVILFLTVSGLLNLTLKWAGHVAIMNIFKIFTRKPVNKRPLENPREENVSSNLIEVKIKMINWIQLPKGRSINLTFKLLVYNFQKLKKKTLYILTI